jgi:hypothetical protein
MLTRKFYAPDITGGGHRKNDPRKNDPTKQDESDNDHTRITPETDEQPEKTNPETPKIPGRAEEYALRDTGRTNVVSYSTYGSSFGFNPTGGRRLPY